MQGAEAAFYEKIGSLSEDLAAALAENEKLKQFIDVVKARMLERYVNKVFNFVALYCVAVGVLLLLSGLPRSGFRLPTTILGIIAGSTAVSVIGLIGFVITGLFGRSRS